jgi:predicted transcriptional regulator
MVNVFNENNKLIKESNKMQKSEKEMSDLIKKNNEIQDDCKKIEDKVSSAKEFATVIDLILDSILDPAIPELKEKYSEKNISIDECDELFDKANA